MYPKNNASPEPIAIGAVVQISDGAVQTSGCTVRIKPIGVAEGDGGGTTSYSTDGIVYYTPTQAETNYTSFILIAKKTGCIPVAVTVVTTASAFPGVAWADVRQLLGTAWLTPATAGTPDVNAKQINANATAAARLAQMFGATRVITVDDATFSPTTTAFETDQTTDNSERYTEQVLFGLSGANAGVTIPITGYAFTNSKVKLTVETMAVAPSNGDQFLIMGRIEQTD